MVKNFKLILIVTFIMIFSISFALSNTSDLPLSIQIVKGAENIVVAEDSGKQVFKIGDVQIIVDIFLIKNLQINSNNVTIALSDTENITIFNKSLELPNNRKILFGKTQSFTLDQSPTTAGSLIINPASTNKGYLKIQDTDSFGNKITFLLDNQSSLELTNTGTAKIISGEVSIVSLGGETTKLKQGDSIATQVPTQSNTDKSKPQVQTQKKSKDETNTENKSPILNDINQPTDFGNDLSDFSPTKIK